MTQNVATGQSIALDAKIKALPPGKYKLRWDMVKTGSFWFSTQGVPWSYRVYFEVPNQLPHTTSMTPLSGYRPDTLRPVLRMTGTDPDNYPGTGLNYQFAVCDSAGANCTFSAQQSATYWRVSADRMAWSQTYTWKTRVYDGGQWGPWSGLAVLKPEVPQPSITSHLAGKPDGGVDPGVANFTTSTTDTAIAVVGPDLAVTRTYNSSDPRKSLAFGSGWSTRWDAGLVPDDDGSGNVVITYPNGRQARFGLNPDGSYAAPAGQTDILVSTAAGGWKLRTVGNIRYEFDSNGDLVTITDARGRAQQLTYTAGQLSEAKDAASGRSLTFTWTSGHVTKVTTGPSPALTWTYTYSGDRLTQACNPEAECIDYGWVDGNGYRTAVTDSNPAGYWRLADADSGAVASEVPGLGKNLAGTANAVVADPAGPIQGNGAAAGKFDGSSSYVKFDDNPLIGERYRSVELWFKTSSTQGGVLVNTSKFAPGQTGSSGSMPALYVGTNGILYGHFCNGQVTGITSPSPVNNGAWHHVVLSQTEGKQWMYLDGQLAGSQDTGQWCGGYTYTYLGAGLVTTNSWPNRPVNAWGYFDGSIAEAAAYTRPVTPVEASEHYEARGVADRLAKIAEPGAVVATDLIYNRASERVTQYTDANGAVWKYGTPSVAESVDADDNTFWRTSVAVTDPIGEDAVYTYDPTRSGRLVSVTNPDDRGGGSVTYDYDEDGFLYTVTDPNGYPTDLRHNKRGHLLSRTTPYGTSSTFTEYWEYFVNPDDALDPRNDQVTFHRNARSASNTDDAYKTRYIHNEYGQVEQILAPGATTGMELITTRVYTDGAETGAEGSGTMPPGLLRQVTEPGNRVTQYSYTSAGDLAWQLDPAGKRIDYTYDGIGRRVGSTVAASEGAAAATTSYTYDGASRTLEELAPVVTNAVTDAEQQQRTAHTYNANGWLTSTTVSDAKKAGSQRTTTFGYDTRGRRTSVTAPDGGVETVTYTIFGDVKTRTDAAGTDYSYSYTPTHRGWQLAETTVHGWSGDGQPARDIVLESHAYDPGGRLGLKADAMGNTLRFLYFRNNESPRVLWRLGYLEPAPVGTGVSG